MKGAGTLGMLLPLSCLNVFVDISINSCIHDLYEGCYSTYNSFFGNSFEPLTFYSTKSTQKITPYMSLFYSAN